MRKGLILIAVVLMASFMASAQTVEDIDVSKEANGYFSKEINGHRIEGTVQNGVKVGTWYEIFADKNLINKVVQFEKGVKNGVYLEIDETGALVKKSEYKNDELNGATYSWFRGGRLSNKATYKDNVLDGEQIKCY